MVESAASKVPTQHVDEVSENGFICEVAFGYASIEDAKANRKTGEEWDKVHSDHLKHISDTFLK